MTNSLLQRPVFWASLAGGVAAAATMLYMTRKGGKVARVEPLGKAALNPKEFIPFQLESIKHESHNTAVFRFKFADPNDYAGMPISSCLVTKIEVEEMVDGVVKKTPIIRPYTPISDPMQRGYLDLLIKKYPDGKMTPKLFEMKPGDKLDFKGPFEKILYVPNKWKHVGMLAGGTGITPMWQVIKRSLQDPTDQTKITLLYANVSPDDILLKKELDQAAKEHKNRFSVHYTIDKPAPNWTGFTGYINEQMYRKAQMPVESSVENIVFVCGNEPMMRALSGSKLPDKSQGEVDPKSLLGKLGFTKDSVFKF